MVLGIPPRSAERPKARDTAFAAIGKARLWLEEVLAGGSFAEIAKREGKGERQIRLLAPLAFTPPAMVRDLINGTVPAVTVTEMAKSVPCGQHIASEKKRRLLMTQSPRDDNFPTLPVR